MRFDEAAPPGALENWRREQARISTLASEPERRQARRALLALRREGFQQLAARCLRAAHRADTAKTEALVWFWCNHFNVYWQKGPVGAAFPDYVDNAIRPHIRGRFRDLLLAAITHPAMLIYLDNDRNLAGKINENLARELLELHTLGVDGGYSQDDVQALARVLTGFGLRPLKRVRWPPKLAGHVREHGEFMFDPRRHDFGPKRVLGQPIDGLGYAEIETIVDLLATHPSTARHLAGKLAMFLVGEHAPTRLIERAAATYLAGNGELAPVVELLVEARRSPSAGAPNTFKDPHRWVLSSLGVLAAGRPLQDVAPPLRWLTALGQPLFGSRTPDGYSLRGSDWLGSGQLTQRFELANEMVRALPRLTGSPVSLRELARSPAVSRLEARLGAASRKALAQADSPASRLALLISSPEFMYWPEPA